MLLVAMADDGNGASSGTPSLSSSIHRGKPVLSDQCCDLCRVLSEESPQRMEELQNTPWSGNFGRIERWKKEVGNDNAVNCNV